MLGARISRPSRQPIESGVQLIDFGRDRDVDVVRDAPTEIQETAESRRSDEHERRVWPELTQLLQSSDLSGVKVTSPAPGTPGTSRGSPQPPPLHVRMGGSTVPHRRGAGERCAALLLPTSACPSPAGS